MWIKILGCYDENAISINEKTTSIVFSIGMCQEYCTKRKTIFFGIKESRCACIDKLPSVSSLPPSQCNSNCLALLDMQVLPFNECGGQTAYNVYISGTESEIQSTETTINTACVAIQCSGDSKYLYENDCNLSYSRICDREDIEINRATPLTCQRCSKRGCLMVQNCSEIAQYRCFGVRPTTKNTPSVEISNNVRNNSPTSVSTAEPINTKITPSTLKNKTTTRTPTLANTIFQSKITIQTESSGAEIETYLNILLPISIILTSVLVLTGATVIIIRWRKCGEQDIDQIEDQQQDDTNQYAQVDKTRSKKSISLEPQPKSPECSDVRGMVRAKISYTEKNEGVYDHLGETNFPKEVKEETYDHAGFVVGSGDCDYETTQGIQRREQESTYDHAGIIHSEAATC
ncbi:uncharacterized protein LOC134233239 isoform X2 [Saccostrea cucullata]